MCTPSSTVYKSTDKVYASNNLHLFLLGLSRCSCDFFFFFADDGISIPCEYTSFLAPIAAPKLHFEVAQSNDSGKGPSVILHATLKTLRSRGVFSMLCSIQFLWCSWGEFSSLAGYVIFDDRFGYSHDLDYLWSIKSIKRPASNKRLPPYRLDFPQVDCVSGLGASESERRKTSRKTGNGLLESLPTTPHQKIIDLTNTEWNRPSSTLKTIIIINNFIDLYCANINPGKEIFICA